jgi:hypothetical protein
MKVEAITYLVLKVLGYIAGFVGAFAILGFTGECELLHTTPAQYIIQEFYALCLICFSFAVYYIRERIRKDFIKRDRAIRRKAKRATVVQ